MVVMFLGLMVISWLEVWLLGFIPFWATILSTIILGFGLAYIGVKYIVHSQNIHDRRLDENIRRFSQS